MYGENKWVALQDGTGGTVNAPYSTDTLKLNTTPKYVPTAVNGLIYTGTNFIASPAAVVTQLYPQQMGKHGQMLHYLQLKLTLIVPDGAGKVWILGESAI